MTPNFDIRGTGHPQAELSVNGLNAVINTPRARHSVGDRKDEFAQDLPGYAARRPYLVDDYPACPENWVRSSSTMKSYFVPVNTGNELWLDFNGNNKHPYHLAVVVSVQGINAVTGLECKDTQLEQYLKECPKHKEEFGPDRYCKSCGYHWPKQNYICTTGTPHGCLWLDGFRAAEGVIRQFLLTADKMRSVAGGIIGENRVFAFGISFFLSRSPRAQQIVVATQTPAGMPGVYPGWQNRCCSNGLSSSHGSKSSLSGIVTSASSGSGLIGSARIHASPQFFSPTCNSIDWQIGSGQPASPDELQAIQQQLAQTPNDPGLQLVCGHSFDAGDSEQVTQNQMSGVKAKLCHGEEVISQKQMERRNADAFDIDFDPDAAAAQYVASAAAGAPAAPIQAQKLEIAAGARIDQIVYPDPSPLDFWRDQPEGVLVINYVTEADCQKILAAGEVKQPVHAEGFLQAVPVGN